MEKQYRLLETKLEARKESGLLRQMRLPGKGADFCSNDYLGLKDSLELKQEAIKLLSQKDISLGSGGSRLLAGNSEMMEKLESDCSGFFFSETSLFFNSGYDANIGLFSAVPQKDDVVLYDELVHASIRDGIRLSFAKSYSFEHNTLAALEERLARFQTSTIYVATESVYSMDGDLAPLSEMLELCEKYGAALIVDEAHATGVIGLGGRGLCMELGIQDKVFARIYTFGKALGTHGAAVCGKAGLREYLLNFSRSFIYTTALSPFQAGLAMASLKLLQSREQKVADLRKRIRFFDKKLFEAGIAKNFITSGSAIKSLLIGNTQKCRELAAELREKGFEVMPVLSPTVAVGRERIRICVHEFNTEEEIEELIGLLKKALS